MKTITRKKTTKKLETKVGVKKVKITINALFRNVPQKLKLKNAALEMMIFED